MRGLCKPQVQGFEPSLEPLLRGAVGKDSNGVVKSDNAVGAEVAQAALEKTIIAAKEAEEAAARARDEAGP